MLIGERSKRFKEVGIDGYQLPCEICVVKCLSRLQFPSEMTAVSSLCELKLSSNDRKRGDEGAGTSHTRQPRQHAEQIGLRGIVFGG